MKKITRPTGPITIEQAAMLLADALHPGADAGARHHNFRWMLNGLLTGVQTGKRLGRLPVTMEPIGTAGIDASTYASLMVFNPDDVAALAAERGIKCVDEFAAAPQAAAPAPHVSTPPTDRRRRHDLLTPIMEAAQKECEEVFNMDRAITPPRPQLLAAQQRHERRRDRALQCPAGGLHGQGIGRQRRRGPGGSTGAP